MVFCYGFKGRRCDKLIFIVGSGIQSVPKNLSKVVELKTSDAYTNLVAKSFGMFEYAHANNATDFDWLLKADDDTYVIVENLRWFLARRCRDEPKTYGFNFNIAGEQYHSGGGGYVVSAETVRRLNAEWARNRSFCETKSIYEDIEVARCLRKLNVSLGESRDPRGRERFHGISLMDYWDGTKRWIESYAMHWPEYVYDTLNSSFFFIWGGRRG